MQSLPYRPNVCMLLFNSKGQLFLGERNREAGIWQLPQGGAEPTLTLEQNVIKELGEELGLHPSQIRISQQLQATHTYDFVTPPPYAVGRWRGQTQTFWLVQFLGQDSDIQLNLHSPPEFMSWRWCTPNEVRSLAEPKRLPGYLQPLAEFEAFISKLQRSGRP